jgi:uncharacterized metal-binding protein YceD (DUF177 family)
MRGEFSQPLRLDQVRDGERMDLTAEEGERRAIAERLGLQSLDRLDAHVTFARDGDRIEAKGRLKAALEQSCVATGDPVAERIDEAFAIAFVPEPGADTPEEIELSDEDCDIVFYEGGTIDLGAAIADTLALSMNPYPRSADAEIALRDAGVLTEAEAGPFAALAKLKRNLGET